VVLVLIAVVAVVRGASDASTDTNVPRSPSKPAKAALSIDIDKDNDGYVDADVIEQCAYFQSNPEQYGDLAAQQGYNRAEAMNALRKACASF
jgi:hypothetical protein